MKERCWICKKWKEHFYWDHFEETKFRFMKIMDENFTQKMEFPQKFAENFRVELFDVVALEAPSGKLWEIGLCKEQEHFYFNGGWKEFIEENEIEEGDILIFKYAGDSKFCVRIFDETGCVRAASNLIDNGRAKQKPLDQTWRNFRNMNSSRTDCNDHPMLHEQTTDKRCASSGGFKEDEEHGMGEVKDDGRVIYSGICRKEFSEQQSDSKSETKISVRNSHHTIKILELKFANKEGNCSFVKLFSKCSLGANNPFLAIPINFVREHIPQKPHGITVCTESNKKLYVNCRWERPSWGFCGRSLHNLVQENKLQKGDACVFELIRGNCEKLVMEMRIVRAEEVCSILKNSFF